MYGKVPILDTPLFKIYTICIQSSIFYSDCSLASLKPFDIAAYFKAMNTRYALCSFQGKKSPGYTTM